MKEKIFSIITIFIIFLTGILLNYKKDSKQIYKILKVKQADTFYVDFNKNNKIDDNELVQLSSVIAFSTIKNEKTEKLANKKEIDIFDYLKLGFLAKTWAQKTLEGKEVEVIIKNNFLNTKQKAEIFLNNQDVAKILLKNGLAYLDSNSINTSYISYYNPQKIKKNIKELNKINFLLLNKTTNTLHKFNCNHTKDINNAEIFSQDYINTPNIKLCKNCLNETKFAFDYTIPKNKFSYKTSISKKFEEIELFLINPYENKKPKTTCENILCKRIVEEINKTNSSIDFALYGIAGQEAIVNALLKAKERGVVIRSIFDYSNNMDKIYPDTRKVIEILNSKTDNGEILMHNKFFIFDNEKILTGSANISPSGSGGYNSNSVVLINSKELALIFKNEFEQMYSGKFSIEKQKETNEKIKLKNSEIIALFSPKQDIFNNILLPKIKSAKEEVIISAFYLTDKKFIEEIINAKNRGVKIYILLDALGAQNFKDRINKLRENKIPTKIENWGGKNHEKTILFDRETLIIGSANFSKSAFYKNDENIVVIKNKEIAKFYRDYFFFLFNKIDDKYFNLYPRSEGHESINSCTDGIDNNFDGKIDTEDIGCKI